MQLLRLHQISQGSVCMKENGEVKAIKKQQVWRILAGYIQNEINLTLEDVEHLQLSFSQLACETFAAYLL